MMKRIVRFVPGVAGVLAGFVALKLIGLLGLLGWPFELIALVVVYLLVAAALDRAFADYGR